MPLAHEFRAFGSSSNLLLATKVLTISSIGIYAGTALSFNIIIAPSLRKFASSSSLAVWAEMFLAAKPFQISLIVLSALGGSILFYKTKNPYYLSSSALMASLLPYSYAFLVPINTKLLDIRKHGGNDHPVEELLIKWDALHFGRTLIGYGALVLTIYGALREPSGRVLLK